MVYYLFQFVIQVLLSCVVVGLYYLCTLKKQKNVTHVAVLLIAVNVPYLYYQLVNPLFNGMVFTALSSERSPLHGRTVRNWGDTVTCVPKQILLPTSEAEVRQIVMESSKVRVVGSGHSFSPLICTDYTLLSLEKMNHVQEFAKDTVTCEAGATIKHLLSNLLNQSNSTRIIHGFGSIQDQSLAGAFSTSHHGLTFHSFAEDVKSIRAVLANGSIVETSNLFYWRSHLGLLGVITSMTIRTYPNSMVRVMTEKITLNAAIQKLPQADAGIIETNYGQREKGLLKYITIVGKVEDVKYPIQSNSFLAAVWDSVIMPSLVLFPSLSSFPLLDFADENVQEAPMLSAWTKFPEYGMMYSAYAIPFQNCSHFVASINTNKHWVSTILIRYVHGQSNTTCLTFASKDSCVVDVYDLQSQDSLTQFHLELETLVHAVGGTSHWGKYYVSGMKQQVQHIGCYEAFKWERERLDPDQKFVNEYTKEILDLQYKPESARFKQKRYQLKRTGFVLMSISSFVTTTLFLLMSAFRPSTTGYTIIKP